MKILFVSYICLLLSISTLGEDKVPVKSPKPGYQEIDMNQFKGLDVSSKPKSGGLKIEGVCTSVDGKDHKPEDIGFDRCMSEAAASSAKENGFRNANGTTPTYKLKFGNK